MQTYLPGDTIRFVIEVEHDFNLGDAWAVFVRREDPEGFSQFRLHLDATTIEEIRREGTTILSQVAFEVTLRRDNHIAGEFALATIRALPHGVERHLQREGIDLGAPEVSFSIAEEPTAPAGEVKFWSLGRPEDRPRYLD